MLTWRKDNKNNNNKEDVWCNVVVDDEFTVLRDYYVETRQVRSLNATIVMVFSL